MMRALLRKQYLEILYLLFGRGRMGKAGGGKGMVALAVVLVICFLILLGFLIMVEGVLCTLMLTSGLDDAYFLTISTMGLVMGLMGSVFMAYSAIFKAKDNDILLAMPIPLGRIILARLLGCYLVAAVFQGGVLLPGYLIYYVMSGLVNGSRNIFILAGDALLLVTAPFLTLALSCLLAWLIALVVKRIRHKSLVGVVLSLAAFGAYYYFLFNMDTYMEEFTVEQGEQIAHGIETYAPPLYFMGMAGAGHIFHYLVFTAAVLALFGGVYWLVSRTFLRLSSGGEAVKAKAYTGRGYKVSGVRGTLLRREFKHLTSSTTVMMNGAMGTAMALLLGIAAVFKRDLLVKMFALDSVGLDAAVTYMIACYLVLIAVCMNLVAAVSVSLEGRSLWRLKSLPIDPGDVLWAKAMQQILLNGVPCLFAGVALGIAFRPGIGTAVAATACMLVLGSLVTLLDLMIGLKKPKLDWRDEAMALKMSAAVMFAMLLNLIVALGAGGIFGLCAVITGNAVASLTAVLVLGLIASALMVLWMRGRGRAAFEALS